MSTISLLPFFMYICADMVILECVFLYSNLMSCDLFVAIYVVLLAIYVVLLAIYVVLLGLIVVVMIIEVTIFVLLRFFINSLREGVLYIQQ